MGSCPHGGRVVDGGARHVGRVAVFAGAGGYPFAGAPTDRFISAMGVSDALALVGAVAEMGLCPAGAKWPCMYTLSPYKDFTTESASEQFFSCTNQNNSSSLGL